MTRSAALPTRPRDILRQIQEQARRIRELADRGEVIEAPRADRRARRAPRNARASIALSDLASIGATAGGIDAWAERAIRQLDAVPRTSSAPPAVYTVTIGQPKAPRSSWARRRRLPLITYPRDTPAPAVQEECPL